MSFEDQSKLVPSTYQEKGFEGDLTLDYQRAQSPDSELWLFQFPPQITTEDFAASGCQIPVQSKLTQVGKHVQIGTFSVNGVRYALSEAPADSVQNMVNFWSSEDQMEEGIVHRGKPFHRLFIATIEVANNLGAVRQVIDAMPMGSNKPFISGPIKMPIGLDNPWDGGVLKNGKKKNANILKQLKESPFAFTSGNFDATMSENKKWVGDIDVFENHYFKPIEKSTKKENNNNTSNNIKKEEKKQSHQQQQQQQQQQKQPKTEPEQPKKRDQPRVEEETEQNNKKTKNNKESTTQSQQLVQLGKTQPKEEEVSKKSKKDKKDKK